MTSASISAPAQPPPTSVWQRQFQQPAGLIGRLCGWIMARQNRAMYRAAIRSLDVRSGDEVLEIGSGPGEAIGRLVEETAARSIVGIDLSPVILEQAREKNRQAMHVGRVALLQASVAALPLACGQFSRVFAVSTFHDWENRGAGLAEVHRVLRPGGRLVLCLRRAPRHVYPWSSPGVTEQELAEDEQLLRQHRFIEVSLFSRRFPSRIVCLVATR